ncbi:MAG: hypothetical protein UX94_C0006G0018 [Parcubacteria group bacterium GW2011_GWA2_47_21]|nr:MAG: hypothetical protein UX94_C0006G0018 [Parcubacteria group bacterium GW2011_GWA2_47_21]
MPKKIIQDVLPGRRTIRDISLSERTNQRENAPAGGFRNPRATGRFGIWLAAIIALVALAAAFSVLFTGAKMSIVPKQVSAQIGATITAKQNPSDKELGFEFMILRKEAKESVPTSGEEYVEKKASGKIIVYNNFSSAPQRLIKNTRFETPTGLIFRIDQSIVLPGQTKENNKVVPGSAEVSVFADSPGAEYNIGLTDFTVPGFKSDPTRFKNFYARSKTPMTGGFAGMMKKVPDETLKITREKLRQTIRDKVLSQVGAEAPSSSIFYPAASFFTFESLPHENINESTVSVREMASSTAVIFDRLKLANFLAMENITGYEDENIKIDNLSELQFALIEPNESPVDSGVLTFSLKGEAKFTYQIDKTALAKDLAGQPKKETGEIIKSYKSIEKTEVVVRPFWKKNFPSNPKDIKIIIKESN